MGKKVENISQCLKIDRRKLLKMLDKQKMVVDSFQFRARKRIYNCQNSASDVRQYHGLPHILTAYPAITISRTLAPYCDGNVFRPPKKKPLAKQQTIAIFCSARVQHMSVPGLSNLDSLSLLNKKAARGPARSPLIYW